MTWSVVAVLLVVNRVNWIPFPIFTTDLDIPFSPTGSNVIFPDPLLPFWPPDFSWYSLRDFAYKTVWYSVPLTVGLSAAVWLPVRWRYSLRTLLIATTLFAVVLGMIMWMSRA